MQQTTPPSIAIIGAGFSGLCAGIRLQQAGIDNFTIFERGEDVGGVWRENTYPGAACDVPCHLYSFSFEKKTEWSCPYPEQPEILEYQRECAEKYGLYAHTKFNTRIESATYDEANACWTIQTDDGATRQFSAIITAVGQLSRPSWPNIQGMDEFAGHSFHSAEWEHDHDLTGKTVAVIGTGASAIQFVPEIAKRCARVIVFQRSAPYLLPRFQRQYSKLSRWLLANVPGYSTMFRKIIRVLADLSTPAFHDQSRLASVFKWVSCMHMKRQVKDPALREKLTPDYPIGCKRVLFSSNYFPALARANVDLITDPISHISAAGVVTEADGEHAADTIIYGTGFKATEFLAPMEIRGRDGLSLSERWANGAEAYRGITVDGFPNLFMCYGPNTNLGGNSIIWMIECQMNYIVACVQKLDQPGINSMDVKPQVIADYNRDLQQELNETVWGWGCSSWYHTADGRITNNWPGTNLRYYKETAEVDFSDYELQA